MSSNLAPECDLPSRPPISTRASQILWGPRPDEPDHDLEPDAAEVVDRILFALGVEDLTEGARADVTRPIVRLLRDLEDERARRSESERAVAALNALVDDVEARRDAQERELDDAREAFDAAYELIVVALGDESIELSKEQDPSGLLADLIKIALADTSGLSPERGAARRRLRQTFAIEQIAGNIRGRQVLRERLAETIAIAEQAVNENEALRARLKELGHE